MDQAHSSSLILSDDFSIVQDEVAMQEDMTLEDTVMSVSTSFHPGSHPGETDLVFSSSEGVLFYVHTDIINKASPSALAAFLRFSGPGIVGSIISIPEPAPILNILLHTLYHSSCAPNSPSTGELIAAVDKMPSYGMEPKSFIIPQSPLYTLLLARAPLHPLDIYALASYHDIPELAVQTSSHLLGFKLDTITDELAARIGPVNLKSLFLLHMKRTDTLRKLLLQPPSFHPKLKDCDFDAQKRLTRAWALGSTYLAWDVQPGEYEVYSLLIYPLTSSTLSQRYLQSSNSEHL